MQPEALPQVEIDLDIELKADHSGLRRKELLQNLEDQQKEIEGILNKGCSPVDYPLFQGLLVATESAKEVIECVWGRFHRSIENG